MDELLFTDINDKRSIMYSTANILTSKTEKINSSGKVVDSKKDKTNQLFSFGPFLNIFSGNNTNTIITTNSTVIIKCNKKIKP